MYSNMVFYVPTAADKRETMSSNNEYRFVAESDPSMVKGRVAIGTSVFLLNQLAPRGSWKVAKMIAAGFSCFTTSIKVARCRVVGGHPGTGSNSATDFQSSHSKR